MEYPEGGESSDVEHEGCVVMFEEGGKRCSFRARALLARIVELAYVAGDEGISWVQLLSEADPEDRYSEATIEGAIRDLGVLGVLWRKGAPPRRGKPELRRVVVTDLGAWLWEGRFSSFPVPWLEPEP